MFSSRTTLNASACSCRLRPCLKFAAHRCSFRPQKSLCAPCSRRSPQVPARRTGAMRWLARLCRSCVPKCFWHTCIHCRKTLGGVPSQNRRGLRSNSKTKMTQIMVYLSPVHAFGVVHLCYLCCHCYSICFSCLIRKTAIHCRRLFLKTYKPLPTGPLRTPSRDLELP